MSKIAIACQGGGSHNAFTAGALRRLLPELAERDADLVGLSGTSGGAITALTAWYGLLADGPESVPRRLNSLWADIAADEPLDRFANEWLVRWLEAETAGAPVPMASPYQAPGAEWGQRRLRQIVERHVDFAALPDLAGEDSPKMVISAVDINSGVFETFEDGDITAEAVMASAAVPVIFEAVKMKGHYHWDGLFSQNPPVHELMQVPAERKPDELWVVQISPQTHEGEPVTLPEIADRRSELSGNISLHQELRFVQTVNRWLDAGYLPDDKFTHTRVRRLPLARELSWSTKFDRSPRFLEGLLEVGEERAGAFLEGLE